MIRAERRLPLALLALLSLAAPTTTPDARAQSITVQAETLRVVTPDGTVRMVRGFTVGESPALAGSIDFSISKRPFEPLAPPDLATLRGARGLRDLGRLDQARDSLTRLNERVPHHPLVVSELGRLYMAAEDYAAVEKLGRFERYHQKDSLLLGVEMAGALAQLGRHRDAVRIVLETWGAAPDRNHWGNETILGLLANDPRGIRDQMKRAVQQLPERLDLVRTLARIEWRLGNTQEALRVIDEADQRGSETPLRWTLAEEMLQTQTQEDSTAAVETFLALAGDETQALAYRMAAARRAWRIMTQRKAETDGAKRLLAAFGDLAPDAWQPDLLIAVARELRRAGLTAEARALLDPQASAGRATPEMALERALADLRDGLPERAIPALEAIAGQVPEAAFRFAEALFYSGQTDSALVSYGQIAMDPRHPFAGASLERMYLIEDAAGDPALKAFGRIAYADWRDDKKHARALAESLYTELPRGPLWAQAAIALSHHLEESGKLKDAIHPVLALADSLPDDRLASLARQKAGDLYMRLEDEPQALKHYEECLARYPRAWNAPEVRRKLLKLRKELPIDAPQTPSTAS